MKPEFQNQGFLYPDDLVMAFIGGSQLHGAKLEGTDDTDWYGVYIEPKELALGIDSYEHFVYTTGGQRGGNGPGDVDITLYGLNKAARLLAKGNPSMLHFLYAPTEYVTAPWAKFALHPEPFIAKSHAGQFLGFAGNQLRRLFKQQGQKNVHREALEEKFGYDTKYAMHVVRLFGEAKEFLETGKITLPRPNKDELIAIRKGEWTLNQILEYATQLEAETLKAKEHSPIPEHVNRITISKLVAQAYIEHWDIRASQEKFLAKKEDWQKAFGAR